MTPPQQIARLSGWRGKTLAAVRKAIRETGRDIAEEWKWRGSPVWSRDGMIAVGNAHKDKVKLTFSHGAKLADPDRLFNAGLGGGTWRASNFSEGARESRKKRQDRQIRSGMIPSYSPRQACVPPLCSRGDFRL